MALRAFELAIDYAQRRQTSGKPIAGHQAIAFKLAEMACPRTRTTVRSE